MDQLQLNIQKERLEIKNKQTEIRQQNLEEIILQTQQEQRHLLELTNRDQISEKENTFSQNIISGTKENFTYFPDEGITFAPLFLEDSRIYTPQTVLTGQTLRKLAYNFKN